MDIEKLLTFEAEHGFEDINAIRESGFHSFLDEWIVTGLLGRGSFGNVYRIVKIVDGLSTQECALKVCQVGSAEDAELKRQEIEAQRLLSGHAHTVQIEDYSIIYREPPRVSYIIIRMELLTALPSDGLNEYQTVRLGIDICDALEKCASMNPKLIHCDIKPANILVDKTGRYKLGDFGSAKTLQATMTYTGNRGTPLYMAPEVAYYSGYDGRCDIFSLGYTLLTMLNKGKHPYQNTGSHSDTVWSMYESKTLPHIDGVSPGLMKIIGKMCEPSLRFRYSRPSEVKRDLEQFIRRTESAERASLIRAERRFARMKKKRTARLSRSTKAIDKVMTENRNKLSDFEGKTKKTNPKFEKRIAQLKTDIECISSVRKSLSEGYNLNLLLKIAGRNGLSRRSIRRIRSAGKPIMYRICLTAVLAVLLFSGIVFAITGRDVPMLPESGEAVITQDGLVLAATDDRNGYKVIGCDDSAGAHIIVPSDYQGYPVLEIGAYAFEDSTVSDVTLSRGIVSIGEYAFSGCTEMKSIKLPHSIIEIQIGAFMNCRSLKAFVLPEDIKSISGSTFDGCLSLVKIIIPSSVEEIGEKAFYGCESLRYITLPDNLRSIGKDAFTGCSSVRITAPDSPDYYGLNPDDFLFWYTMPDTSEAEDN